MRQRLAVATKRPPPPATARSLINLGRGVAFLIDSPDLKDIRGELADAFAGLLTPQDNAGWRPHVTIQNKVEPHVAKALHATLSQDFQARPIGLRGLAAWWYRGGPWELLASYPFR